jgi:hypothetical protein
MMWIRTAAVLLLAARAVLAWDHVLSGELKRVVEIGNPVLVACEYHALVLTTPGK